MKSRKIVKFLLAMLLTISVVGCQKTSKKTVIELVSYKMEATKYFEKIEKDFNATHDDIELKIDSPNDAVTVLKTRFIRDDYPDIIAIGGEMTYSNFLDANILEDISDYKGLQKVNSSYLDMLEKLELVPTKGTYGLPYAANAAGVLYNKEIFKKYGWTIPQTWDELINLCKDMKSKGVLPFYFGFKDTWTTMAPWNALAVNLASSDVTKKVNRGETTFTKEYSEVADKLKELVKYGEKSNVAYGYTDACSAFAKGEAAMYTIGSYAIPYIKSVNPKIQIDSFTMPGNNDATKNVLNSGIDLQFCMTKANKKKKQAIYKVFDYLLNKNNVQKYVTDQTAVPCIKGDFKLPKEVSSMASYIKSGKMVDFQDHYYPSEMSVDAIVQSYIIDGNKKKFLSKFDADWIRYNRDIIRKVKDYEKSKKGSD